jgi:hypothetical protein
VLLTSLATWPAPVHAAPEDIPPELEAILAEIESGDFQIRMLACRKLRKKAGLWLPTGDEESGGPSMATAGGGSTTSKMIHFFDLALEDKSQNVIRAAMRAAVEVPLPPVWAHLKQVIQRERGAHVTALTRVIGVQAFTELSKKLAKKSASPGMSVTTVSAATQLGVVLTTDPSTSVRAAAATGLGDLGDPKGVEILEDALVTETSPLVTRAIEVSLVDLTGTFDVCLPL